jgi:uncharacterized protein (DUF1778 family)
LILEHLVRLKTMPKESHVGRRRAKSSKSFKLVIYLSEPENSVIERAAGLSGKSKSAFGADVILTEAKKLLTRSR